MYRNPSNPRVLELAKSWTSRSICLDHVKPLETNSGKLCAWCHAAPVKGPKYCGRDCRNSARAWAYPQMEEGLNYLLIRQDFKCGMCSFDYKLLVTQLLKNGRVYDKPKDYLTELSYWLMRRIKQKAPKESKPEVDHIVPISKGGASLGLENHQVLCSRCHKSKTKVDNSGKRKPKGAPQP